MGDSVDIRQLSDPDFLAERARVRETIEALQGRLAERDDEFIERAFGLDGGNAVNHGDLVAVSLSNLREYGDDAARWLAIEVLRSDEAAPEDDDLVIRLQSLQDRLGA